MRMMCRFSFIPLVLWAGVAQAERQLDKQEIMAIVRDYAVCYETAAGDCYAAEFFERVRDDTMDVTYTYNTDGGISVVRERVRWTGNQLCVEDDSSGVVSAGLIASPDQMFRFDLSNAPELNTLEMAMLRNAYDGRQEGYCYGWVADDDGYTNVRTVYGTDGSGGTAPLRFVPLTEGSIELN